MNHKTVTLDVREDIRQGREPFTKIMRTVLELRPDEQFRLIAPFEPIPLFDVMARRGFRHAAQPVESGDWEVTFTRDQKVSEPVETRKEQSVLSSTLRPDPIGTTEDGPAVSQIVDLDARGLEPPQPLVIILEAIAALPVGAQLRARTDRRPVHLYLQLEDRGFTGETEEQPDGSYLTHIRRR